VCFCRMAADSPCAARYDTDRFRRLWNVSFGRPVKVCSQVKNRYFL